MPTLLVNADDYGIHHDINRGIADCVHAGTIQGISVCPVGRALDWTELKNFAQNGVRIGIHFTFVGEPWGTDGRLLSDWKTLARAILTGGVLFQDALMRETRWQLQQAVAHEVPLSHVDSHQHVHMLPVVFGCVLTVAREHGIPRIRIPFCPHRSLIRKNPGGLGLQTLANYRRRSLGGRMACIGIRHAGHNTCETLAQELRTCAAVSSLDIELISHPGITTDELRRSYPTWGFDWTGERDALLNDRFRTAVASAGYTFA